MKRILIINFIGFIVFCFICFVKPVQAWQLIDWDKFEKKTGWTETDVELQSIAMVLHGLDWLQTLKIARNTKHKVPKGHPYYYEKFNRTFLHRYPSKGRTNTYFVLSGIAKPVITHYLPRDYILNLFGCSIKTHPKRWFQYLQIGVSGYNVGRNYSLGLRFSF